MSGQLQKGVIGAFVLAIGLAAALLAREYLSLPDTLTREQYQQLMASREPAIGERISMPAELRQSLTSGNLIILLGSCSKCALGSVDLASIDLATFDNVIAVTTSKVIDLGSLQAEDVDRKVVGDVDLHDTLNAYWTPRFAFLNSKGELLGIQRRDESSKDFASRCANES